MAKQYLINFSKFSESKEILKIGQSEVFVWGGGLKVGLLKCPSLYSIAHNAVSCLLCNYLSNINYPSFILSLTKF